MLFKQPGVLGDPERHRRTGRIRDVSQGKFGLGCSVARRQNRKHHDKNDRAKIKTFHVTSSIMRHSFYADADSAVSCLNLRR